MTITSSLGVGSGIDINGLVTQLVAAEGQPATNALNRQESTTKSRLSALGQLKSALSDFQTAVKKLNSSSTFKAQTATSSNEAVATVTASIGAVSGSYSLEVTQLAKPQKSVTTAEFANLNAPVGEGTLTFNVGTKTPFSVTINPAKNTLAGIRDAINDSTDNNGVTASIINVDKAGGGTISKLVLSAKEPGSANAFTVSGSESGGTGNGLAQLFTAQLNPITAATDAIIKVDGQTATRSTNSITDVIPGITLDLKTLSTTVDATTGATTANPFNINVALDTKAITDASQGFVDAYNKLQGVMKDLGKYDSSTKSAGALVGDATLRNIQNQIRQATGSPVTSATSTTNTLSMIGISIDRDGVMALDSTKFKAAMNTKLSAINEIFNSTNGVAARINTSLTNNLQAGGILDGQTKSLGKKMTGISDQRDRLQLRLDNLQKNLTKQFTAMDSIVGKFKETGNYLAKQLG